MLPCRTHFVVVAVTEISHVDDGDSFDDAAAGSRPLYLICLGYEGKTLQIALRCHLSQYQDVMTNELAAFRWDVC